MGENGLECKQNINNNKSPDPNYLPFVNGARIEVFFNFKLALLEDLLLCEVS